MIAEAEIRRRVEELAPWNQNIQLAEGVWTAVMYDTIDNAAYSDAYSSSTATWMFPVNAGTHSFSVVANRFNGTGTTAIFGQITLLWVPFGSSGGNTPGSPDTPAVAPAGATGQR